MLLAELFRIVGYSRRGKRRARHGAVNHSRPVLERLEDRRLLSAAAAVPIGPMPAACVGLSHQQVRGADVVIDWNATMLEAIWKDATPPTAASRVEAMVGVAVFDAVNAIHPQYQMYPVPGLSGRPARGASEESAAVAAAYAVLTSLYPDQKSMFDSEYLAMLPQAHGNHGKARDKTDESQSNGLAWGQRVADAVLAWRSNDGSSATSTYQAAPAGGSPGQYELTPAAGLDSKPPGFVLPLGAQWGQVMPWAMTSAAQFLPPPPPALGSAQYAADFNKTKSLGAIDSTTRTADQTLYAHFWADVPGHSVTPPGHWDEIAEHVSLQRRLGLSQNARMFAMVNIALADAAINCWGAKYIYSFWRPVTAIRDPRAGALNPATSSDPNWTPLWNTPNFPSYSSGHSTFSGAASAVLASIFGAQTRFVDGSDDMPGYRRSFSSFAAAADEAGESRVMGGIHFEFDNQSGLDAGRSLGNYIAENFLQPREQR